MDFTKVSSCAIAILLVSTSLADNVAKECIPIRQCPQQLKLFTSSNLSQETVRYLRTSHCGYHPENKEPMVWCSRFVECKTPLNEEGTCEDIISCPYIFNLLRVLNTGFKKYLQEYVCAQNLNSKEVKVCCPYLQNSETKFSPKSFDEELVKNISHKIFFDDNIDLKSYLPNHHNDTYHNPTVVSKYQNEEVYLPCETPDHVKGSCQLVQDCAVFQNLSSTVDIKNETIKNYLRKYRCSNNKKNGIAVCCIDTDNNNFEFKNYCGRNLLINSKIYGGENVVLGEYPWMALLKYSSENALIYGCGGSLIDNRHILTAAHCVDKYALRSRSIPLKLNEIILGEYDTSNETDCITSEYGHNCADPVQKYKVQSYKIHNSFDRSSNTNDIAIVRLDRNVKFSRYVRPICLPTDGAFSLQGDEWFTIAGWGGWNNTLSESSTTLRKAKVTLTEKSHCSTTNSQICVGMGNGVSTCYGDSGGPLMMEFLDSNGYSTKAIGVLSSGIGGCGTAPDVFVYVPYFMDWISQTLKELDK